MPKRVTDYRKTLLESLTDPTEAALYLESALEDSHEMFLVALRDVAEARQMAKVAELAGVAREALYRMLREGGNPTYKSLASVLEALGLRLAVRPIDDREDGELSGCATCLEETTGDSNRWRNKGIQGFRSSPIILANQSNLESAAKKMPDNLCGSAQGLSFAGGQQLAASESTLKDVSIAQQRMSQGEYAVYG